MRNGNIWIVIANSSIDNEKELMNGNKIQYFHQFSSKNFIIHSKIQTFGYY